MNRLIRSGLAGAVLAGCWGLGGEAAHAQEAPADQGCIVLKTVAEVEEPFVDASGRETRRLVPATKVVPGNEVVWTIVANNVCEAPADNVSITNAVPEHMTYRADTAFGPGTRISFSVNGSAFAAAPDLTVTDASGEPRTARAEEYSHIRWVLDGPLGPSESVMARYLAVVL